MKIISLFLRNIQALKGEHKIDFTDGPLSEAGLFAITGPTGAGKSTLLDAICLALYNEVPRFGKMSRSVIVEKGAILSKNTLEATAEVVYANSKGTYRSTWSIRHNRNQTLEDYHMSIVQLEPNEILDLKKSQVPDKNTELIGLNFNQFLRAVVLSQGQFAKFLQAKHTERSELLERMTGGQIYRDLSAYCYRYFQKIQEEYQRIQDQQLQLELLNPDQREQLQQEMAALIQQRDQKQMELQHVTEALQQVSRHFQLQESISKEKEHLTTLELQKTDIEWKNNAIAQHEKIQPLLADVKWRNLLHEEWQSALDKWQHVEKQQKQLHAEQEAQEAELLPLNAEQLPWPTWFQQKEDAISALLQQVDLAKSRKADAHQQMQAFFTHKSEQAKALGEKSLLELQGLLDQFTTKHQSKPWHGQSDEQVSAEWTRLTEAQHETLIRLQTAEKKADLQQKTTTLNQQRDRLQEQIDHRNIWEKEAEKEVDQLQTSFAALRNKLPYYEVISLREGLIPHQPCPVCGSLEHPNAHEPLPDLSTLKEIETRLERQKETLQQLRQEKASFIGKHEFLCAELSQLALAQVSLGESHDLMELNKRKTQLAEALSLLETFRQEQQKLQSLQTLIQLKTAVSTHAEHEQALDEQLKKVCPFDKPQLWIRGHKAKWQERQIHVEALTSQVKALELEVMQRKTKWEGAHLQVMEKVKLAGFTDIHEVQSKALTAHELETYQAAISTWERNMQATQTRLEEKQKDLSLIPEEVATWQPQQLQENQNTLAQDIHTLGESLGRLQGLLHQDEERQKQFASLQMALKEKANHRDRWGRLNEKIGSATGDKFSKMVQALHMERLLWLANDRLTQMTPRYRFVTSKNDVSLSQSDDLFIEDLFMGGEIRAASTLSGGESFLTSLALALGLSDMAAGQIQLSCMFIDEGFGTLDGETLDMALDTLEQLQAESQKTIGIISHVQGLKERISTQIQLTPKGNGASTLEVIGPKGMA
jgi:exonuclease SbcC